MKKLHIVILVFIAAGVAVLLSFMSDLTTYDTVASARKKEGKFVHLIAKLDLSQPIEYDAIKNPNYLKFTAVDTLGVSTPVVYHSPKPTDFERSERLVLKGSMKNGQFECKEILMKCPSKYKEEISAGKNLSYTQE
ncbi:MAG TPA: cytochrome c maturation protein CcmE [Parasegetibacter sp.]